MRALDYAALGDQLIDHESMRLRPYRCTSGKLTILVGYNVDDRGLEPLRKALGRPIEMNDVLNGRFTEADARVVLAADIVAFEAQTRAAWPNFDAVDGVRQRAIIDFVFNLGLSRAAKFAGAIRSANLALSLPDGPVRDACWTAVAFHVMDSVWARQVDDGLAGRRGRADRLATMLRTGKDPGRMT